LTLVVLVILAALWAIVLLPPLLRSRTDRINDPIGDFNYRLDVLGRTNGAVRVDAVRIPARRSAAKRRRDVLRVLLLAVGVSGLLALATNMAVLWVVFVVASFALVAYGGLLAWARSVQNDRAAKVRPMVNRRSSDFRTLQRAASS
jgi:hypothetical protein